MNFNKLLPIENYTLISSLTIEEVQKRILENVEEKKAASFYFFKENLRSKFYEGEFTGNNFQINRIIHYRNSFLPIITGHVRNQIGKTFIEIKMRMHILAIVIMFLWLGFIGRFCLFIILNMLAKAKEINERSFSFEGLIPFVMFLCGWFLMFFGFKVESKKSKEFLSTLLEGKETDGY